ncbi:MAG: hypothetical protein LBG25_05025, partial [Spirochaetaceae bacterium]|nr:hypothetical protein [Spirochaetaceae bacterium]
MEFLHIHAKIPDYRGSLCSLSGIKIHFCEFLYNFALKRNKLLGLVFPTGCMSAVCPKLARILEQGQWSNLAKSSLYSFFY